ncbi:MAG: hypothetical protein GY862_35915 [Gammaproteobacteria bacterium]|nr:hypothetical protein [Gammaproteobacteria bacterium]
MNLLNKTVLPHVVLSIAFAISVFLSFASNVAAENKPVSTNLSQFELWPDDPDTVNQFGYSVASDGNTLAIGAPVDDAEDKKDTGAVYVFINSPNGWVQQAKLTVDGIGAISQFGYAVAIDGDILAAGAPNDGTHLSGAVYIFRRRDKVWNQEAKFSGASYDHFGRAVAISGNTIVIGSIQLEHSTGASVVKWNGEEWGDVLMLACDNGLALTGSRHKMEVAVSNENAVIVGAPQSNAAHLFEYKDNNWVETAYFEPEDADIRGFGESVDIDNGIAAVGAILETSLSGEKFGAAYVFEKKGEDWITNDKLIVSDRDAGDGFEVSVATNGNAVLLDAAGADSAGITYLFTRKNAGWQQQMTLAGHDNGDMFINRAVTLNTDIAVIGAPKANGETGAAYVIDIGRVRPWIGLQPPNSSAGDAFGFSIAVDGDTLAAGVPFANGHERNSGAVDIYMRNGSGWEEEIRLTAEDADADQLFGLSVAISGDTLAVAAPYDVPEETGGGSPGAIYIFVRKDNIWKQQAKLMADNATHWDFLGASVSISGNTVAGSASVRAMPDGTLGSVYIFERIFEQDGSVAWQQQELELPVANLTLYELLADPPKGFIEALPNKISVAVDGDSILIGAPRADIGAENTGVAYAYGREGNAWVETMRISPSDILAGAAFGTSVALDGNTAVIGQPGHQFKGVPGSVYVFEFNGIIWEKKAKIIPEDFNEDAFFGYSVDVSKDTMLIGAPYDNEPRSNSGAVYRYTKQETGDWSKQEKFINAGGSDYAFLGVSVAVNGNASYMGMPGAWDILDKEKQAVGMVYISPAITLPSKAAGSYQDSLSINLSCIDCTNIYYTADGSTPTTDSSVYAAEHLISITSTTILKYFSEGGPAGSETVTEMKYVIDEDPPVISITSPKDGAIVRELLSIKGTASDADSGDGFDRLARIELAVQDIATGKYADLDDVFRGFVDHPVWIKTLGAANWQLDTGMIAFANDGREYFISARAVDQAGNTSQEVQISHFIGECVFTSLSLNANSAAILNDGKLDISGRLKRYPYNGQDLSSLEIKLKITAPDGTESTKPGVTNMNSGEYQFSGLSGFNLPGSYTFQSFFAGTPFLCASQSKPHPVLAGRSAGYAVLVQGKISNNEGLEAHDKTLTQVYNLLLKDRGFKSENIRYFNYDTSKAEVYRLPAKRTIQDSIANWACDRMSASPAPFYLVMTDHGDREAFIIDNEIITPDELNAWLGELENCLKASDADSGLNSLLEPRVIVNGACYSGSFIPALSAPGRIVVTSAAAWEESYKGLKDKDGIRSGEFFIDELFLYWGRGNSLRAAFEQAVCQTEIYTRVGYLNANQANPFLDDAVQHPLLDDNGDGQGSNVLVIGGDGLNAETLFLGAGMDYMANPIGPPDIKKVTPTLYLAEHETSAILFLEAINPLKIDPAVLEIRVPSKILTKQGGTGQIDMDLDARFLNKVDTDRFELIYTDFTESGMYELFYKVRDTDTGNLSPVRYSVVYKNHPGNSSPGNFDLTHPVDEAKTPTTLVFDWEDSIDPDGDPFSYTFLIARDLAFHDVVHRQERLTSSFASVDDSTGLEDLETYYWKAVAVDIFGASVESGIRIFSTDNTDRSRGIVNVHINNEVTYRAVGNIKVVPSLEPLDIGVDKMQSKFNFSFPVSTGSVPIDFDISAPGYTSVRTSVTAALGKTVSETVFLRPVSKSPGKLRLVSDHAEINEDAGAMLFYVSRIEGFNGSISVDYAIISGSAVAGSDYILETDDQSIHWDDGDSHYETVRIQIIDDDVYEELETFTVQLSNPGGGATLDPQNQLSVTIIDNEPLIYGSLRFSATEYLAAEGEAVTLAVLRTDGGEGEVLVNYATVSLDGSAKRDEDYRYQTGTLMWSDGEQGGRTFTIDSVDDELKEADENLYLMLYNPTNGAVLKSPTVAEVVIQEALPKLGKGIMVGEGESDAVFSGGISVDDKEWRQAIEAEITEETMLQVTGEIEADSRDVGKKADLLVVTAYRLLPKPGMSSVADQAEKFWVLNGDIFQDWDAGILPAYRQGVTLDEKQRLDIFAPAPVFIDMAFRVFFGYRLENGTIVFNGIKPQKTINAVLHRLRKQP